MLHDILYGQARVEDLAREQRGRQALLVEYQDYMPPLFQSINPPPVSIPQVGVPAGLRSDIELVWRTEHALRRKDNSAFVRSEFFWPLSVRKPFADEIRAGRRTWRGMDGAPGFALVPTPLMPALLHLRHGKHYAARLAFAAAPRIQHIGRTLSDHRQRSVDAGSECRNARL
jgi:hypothetical protein